MKRTDLKNLADTVPFRRFMIETSGGGTIEISRPESIFLSPLRTDIAIVFNEEGSMYILDIEHITAALLTR